MTATWRFAAQGAIGVTPCARKHRHSHYFREPRGAVGIMRAILSSDGTLRGAKLPPDAWDDLPIAALRSRTWKRHRRTQYHPA